MRLSATAEPRMPAPTTTALDHAPVAAESSKVEVKEEEEASAPSAMMSLAAQAAAAAAARMNAWFTPIAPAEAPSSDAPGQSRELPPPHSAVAMGEPPVPRDLSKSVAPAVARPAAISAPTAANLPEAKNLKDKMGSPSPGKSTGRSLGFGTRIGKTVAAGGHRFFNFALPLNKINRDIEEAGVASSGASSGARSAISCRSGSSRTCR